MNIIKGYKLPVAKAATIIQEELNVINNNRFSMLIHSMSNSYSIVGKQSNTNFPFTIKTQ